MFTRDLLTVICFIFLLSCPALAQQNSNPSSTTTELQISLGEQCVTFAPMRNFLEMRLEVTDAKGENVFSQLTTEATLAWNLRVGNGEALAPGLYRYALTLKFSEEQSTTQRGHFIVEQGQQQIWLTTHDGADISGTDLNIARTGRRSLAGLRTGEDSSKRDVNGRGLTEEKTNAAPTEDKPGLREKAALAGTVNRLAKYAADGTTLVDSTLSETGGNLLSFGIPNPIWQVTSTGQSQTYDTTPGLQTGFSAYTHRHAANFGEYPRTLMLGYSPGTTINYGFYAASGQGDWATQIPSFFGISTNANVKQAGSKQMFLYQSPTAGVISVLSSENLGVGQGTDLFLGGSTANGADAPLAIKTNGNVGIGTAAPGAKLDVAGTIRSSALRQELTTYTPNVINGYLGICCGGATPGNRVTAGVVGATIGGGGFNGTITFPTIGTVTGDLSNRVTDWFGTVGGGMSNLAGNNDVELYDAGSATVGGGSNNTASGESATVGGGAANTASGGAATVGGGARNWASSDYATVGGGYDNTVSGFSATMGGGYDNTASGNYAVVPGGRGAIASHYGELAFASGNFSSFGDAQTSLYTLRGTTSNATPTEMFLNGLSARITLESNRALSFDILIVGYALGGFAGGYQHRGVIKRIGGVTSLIGSVNKLTLGEDIATWDTNVEADSTNNALVIKVTGSGNTIRWVATVRTVEVQF